MMKKLFVLGIVSLMVMGLGVMAGAYQIGVYVSCNTGYQSSNTAQVVLLSDVTGGTNVPIQQGQGNFVTAAEKNGLNYYFIYNDPAHAATTAWNVWAWDDSVSADTYDDPGVTATVKLFLEPNPSGGTTPLNAPAMFNVTDVTDHINYGNFTLTGTAGDQNGAYAQTVTTTLVLNNIETGDPGTRTQLQITEIPTTTPEPGSLVAMLSGLVGLVGYGIRRRK
jgi:hypothetical protein